MKKITEKLYNVNTAIEKEIFNASSISQPVVVQGFGHASVPPINIKISEKYFIYLQRYGPPPNLEFNEEYLKQIEAELNCL